MNYELLVMIGGFAIGWLLLAAVIAAALCKVINSSKARDKEFFK